MILDGGGCVRKQTLKICHKITESNMDWNSTWPILNSGFNYQLEHTQCSPVECTNVKVICTGMYVHYTKYYKASSLLLIFTLFVICPSKISILPFLQHFLLTEKRKKKFLIFQEILGAKSYTRMTNNFLIYGENICAFPHKIRYLFFP